MKKLGISLAILGVLAAAAGYGWHRYSHPAGAYATPEACFAAMTEAREKKDFARCLSCLSPKVQNQQVGWLAFQLQLAAGDNRKRRVQVLDIYEKHNLKGIDVMGLMQIHDMPRGKGAGYALDLVGSRVTDKAAFLAETDAVFSDKEKPQEQSEQPGLVDVKIEGDVATANMQSKDGQKLPVFFRRIDRSWLIVDGQEVASTGAETEAKDQRKDVAKKPPEKQLHDKSPADAGDSKVDVAIRARRETARRLGEDGAKGVPALIELLNDKDGEVRELAAGSLGQIGPEAKAAVPALIELLKDKGDRSGTRDSASMALGRIGPDAKEAIPALTELLRESHESVRRPAANALAGIGRPAIPVLIELLKDRDAKVRAEAAGALDQSGAAATAAIPALAELLRDKDEEVRRNAIWALASIGEPAIPALAGLLKDKDGEVRSGAAFVLSRIYGVSVRARTGPQAKAAIIALTDLLKDESAGARGNAADALGCIGSEASPAVPLLIELLKDKDSRVRDKAALALGTIRPKEKAAASALGELLRDPDRQVFRSAALALERLGQTAIPVLTELLKDKDAELRVGAAFVLGKIGAKAKTAIPALTELLKDEDVEVRQTASDALEKIKVKTE